MMRFNSQLKSYSYLDNNLTIIYFKKGAGVIEWKSKFKNIKDNTFIVSNPSEGWDYVNNKELKIDVLSLVISNKLKNEFNTYATYNLEKLIDDPYQVSSEQCIYLEHPLNADHYPFGRLLKSIYNQSFTENFIYTDAEEKAMSILMTMHNNQKKIYKISEFINSRKKSTKNEVLKRLLLTREYIHDNLEKKITLDELTSISLLSKFHLYDSFKNVFGKTPHQYINSCKLKKSKRLILKGQYSVTEISDILGYSDVHTFSKLFKKNFKVSPSNYYVMK
ncbi:helix-turn-helix transcriptional regulator [Aquimarina sp. AU119]|uniref:helix-turn-helix transcriptional regulator n=1 Tax=Aquimarina sp. AU119 TaxID=2108528 RepID=UPI0013590034|nr:AraC family transcriptional regulator [Aquimarina sp. AU119]